MPETVQQLTPFVLAQFAAESYLEDVVGGVSTLLPRRLRLGSNNFTFVGDTDLTSRDVSLTSYTRMTDAQIAQFVERYDVVDHLPNTITGFSATLLWDRPDNKKAEKWVRSCNPTFPPLDCCHGKTIKNRIGGRAVSHYFAR